MEQNSSKNSAALGIAVGGVIVLGSIINIINSKAFNPFASGEAVGAYIVFPAMGLFLLYKGIKSMNKKPN